MAMLTRPTNIKIFGSAAPAAELTDFGGSTPSTDINTILNSVAAERGWGTVGANGFPPMEWFNALGYALSYYSAYIMQSGIPAWTSSQNYYVNSYAVGSDGKLYRSKTGINGTPNVGNNPVGDTTNWESASDMAGAIHNATAKTNINGDDELGIWDVLSGTLKKITAGNLKECTLQTAIASAATTSIGTTAAGDTVHITGTTTITSFGTSTSTNGLLRIVVFDGALTLTHNATSLILPTGANITTAAGDSAEFVCENTALGYWRCTGYQRKDGTPLVVSTATTQAASDNSTKIATTEQVHLAIKNDLNITGSAPMYACRAFLKANASSGTPTLGGSGNISSLGDLAVGNIRVNFNTAMPDINYSPLGIGKRDDNNTIASNSNSVTIQPYGFTTGYFDMFTSVNGVAVDSAILSVAVVR